MRGTGTHLLHLGLRRCTTSKVSISTDRGEAGVASSEVVFRESTHATVTVRAVTIIRATLTVVSGGIE